MGKNPDKKKDKAESKSQAAGGLFAAPSDASDNFKLNDPENKGDLFIITALSTGVQVGTKYGDADYVEADIIHVDEQDPAKSELHRGAWVFGNLGHSLKREVGSGKPVLARLDQGANTKGNPPWILVGTTEQADIDAATAAWNAVTSPF